MSDQAIAKWEEKTSVPVFSMTPRTFDEAMKFAELMSKSDLVPKDFKDKPGNILVAIQKGQEVGLSPMAALETIAVINGRASLWGDGLLGIVQGSNVYEWIDESGCSEKAGICTVKRKGEQPYTATFTLEDAKRAGLLGKAGPWTSYTKRMLQLRARGFALRDKFADVLKGLVAAEEALDTVTVLPSDSDQPAPSSLKDKLKAQLEAPSDLQSKPVAAGVSETADNRSNPQPNDDPPPAQSVADHAKKLAQDHAGDVPCFSFGKHKGKSPYDPDVPDDYLAWVEPMLANNVNDPAKARYQTQNQAILDAVRAAAIDRGIIQYEQE